MEPEHLEILDLTNDDPMVQRAMVRLRLRIEQVDAATPIILAARARAERLLRVRGAR